jgi:hypothetical protein
MWYPGFKVCSFECKLYRYSLVYAPIVEGCMVPARPVVKEEEEEEEDGAPGRAEDEGVVTGGAGAGAGGVTRRAGGLRSSAAEATRNSASSSSGAEVQAGAGAGGGGGGTKRRVSAGRRFVAVTACFAASGLAHEFILWYMGGMKVAPSWWGPCCTS